ncbi:MAG TPA: prolyl oligopeptidase family serine peptidase, partial [Clostridiaceae bacterium]|nr:prolyl oligopeptidase family serine peptidase [Clostridiaceae bacterium]
IKSLPPGQQLHKQKQKLEKASTLESGLEQFLGREDGSLDMQKVREISPVHWLDAEKTYPPFLLLHGDEDRTVRYEQSLLMYKALQDHGTVAEMICVDGADHENDFWSQEVLNAIWDFIAKHI